MKDKLLITAIGSASAHSVIRSLSEQYFIIGTNIYPKEYVAEATMVDSFYMVPPAGKGEEFVLKIIDICIKENCKYILPLTDPEIDVLNEYRDIIEEKHILVCMSDRETITVCRDKRKSASLINSVDGEICIPELKVKECGSYLPIVIKPSNGRSSEGLTVIKDTKALRDYFERYYNEKHIIQPFVDGTIVTADVLRYGSQCIVTLREELLRTSNGLGLSVRIINDESIQKKCVKIATILNVKGCVCFEFIRDNNGKLWFLECNPRFSGGVGFSIIAGYDYPLNHIRCFSNERIDEHNEVKSCYISRKYEEIVTSCEKTINASSML